MPKVERKKTRAPHRARKALFPGSAQVSLRCFRKSRMKAAA